MQAKHQEKPEMTKLDLPVHKNNLAIQHSSPLFKDCHQTENPVNKPVHKKWRSLHLEKQNYDDIRELNDTFTSESDEEILKPKEGNEKEAMLLLDKMESIPENTKHHAKADLFSVTDLSSTICTDMNHLQSTAPLLETDISHIISEVPSVNESELGSTVSALIRHFEITEDKTNLTFVSSLQGPNSQSNFCDNSDVLISDLLNRKKHTRQSLHSASNTTVFSSPETSEYSIYTFIHEEHVPPDANYKLMDANNGISSCSNLKNNSSNSWLDSSESLQFCSQYNANSNTLGLKSKQSRPQVSLKTSSGCTDENVKQISSHNSFLKNLNVDSNPKRIADKNFLHTGVNRYATQACPNSQNTGIQHGSGQLYQNRHSSYKPRADAPRDKQYIAQSGNLHSSPNANWPKPSNYHIHSLQGIKQPSPCISKSLGDLTSDDISCNFESKYKRINRGFLSSAICPENTSLAQSRPQSTDALTEQLRKLMSFDQDDSNRPSYYEEEEWDSPKPLTRKLSSRSQSRVRNIANRAKERQEANKIKQSNLNSSEVVLRNKRSMASQPINRHSTGSYIGSLYNNFNSERLEGRGIPEGACTSHTQVYNDHIDTGFTYRHEPSNTDEPEIYFLLRL